jgi:hypothetical protein
MSIKYRSVDGYIWAAGFASGTVNGVATQLRDVLVWKHDPTTLNPIGNAITYGTSGNDKAMDIMLHPIRDQLILAGTTTGTLPGETNRGGQDIIMLVMDLSGNVLNRYQFGSSGPDITYRMSVTHSTSSLLLFTGGYNSVDYAIPGYTYNIYDYGSSTTFIATSNLCKTSW